MNHYGWVACLGIGLLVITSCGKRDTASTVTRATSPGPPEPSEVELYEPVARFEEPDLVQVEVKYRFTQGKPTHYYLLEVRFPGTNEAGIKPIDGWELQDEGVIRDGFFVEDSQVTEFEIELTEAVVPMEGYTRISNVVTGTVQGSEVAADDPP
jgi:hypothetical protein